MGKCTKKSKITAEVPLVEISRHSSMAPGGVRTRAKTLALRRLRMNTTPNPTPSSCYLELRSRRLHKPPRAPIKPRNQLPRPKQCSRESRGFHSSCRDERDGSSVASCRRTAASCSAAAVSRSCEGHLDHESRTERGDSEESFGGENNLEPDEQTERRASSLASSFIARRLIQGDDVVSGSIPTTREMEEFFALAEQEQRSLCRDASNGCDYLRERGHTAGAPSRSHVTSRI